MVKFMGAAILVTLALVLCVLVVLIGWVACNALIREGLEIYEKVLIKQNEINALKKKED